MPRRLSLLFVAVLALATAAPPAGAALRAVPPRPAPALVPGAGGPQLAAFGRRGFGSRSYGYGYRRPYGYGYGHGYGYRRPHRGRSFLHGLFWGWMLSHFFGGGFPLFFPFLILMVVVMAMRRRRPVYRQW